MMTAHIPSLHNPLNLPYSHGAAWLGLDAREPQRCGLCHFVSESYGLRAALLLLQSCLRRPALRTPQQLAAHWHRNPAALPAYLNNLCRLTGLQPDTQLSASLHLDRLVAAMARLESGLGLTPQQVAQARRRFGL